jgi:hypothetical protein
LTKPTGEKGSRPVRNFLCPPPWSAKVWAMERIRLNLSAILACSGRYSQTSSPGTTVLMGRKSPRYSAGAFGFMS